VIVPFTPSFALSIDTIYFIMSGEPSKLNPAPAHFPLAPFPTLTTVALSAKSTRDRGSDPGRLRERLASRRPCVGACAKTKPVSGAVYKTTTALDCVSSETTSKYHQSQDVELMGVTLGLSRPYDAEVRTESLLPFTTAAGIVSIEVHNCKGFDETRVARTAKPPTIEWPGNFIVDFLSGCLRRVNKNWRGVHLIFLMHRG
jgi:hypothetical protein